MNSNISIVHGDITKADTDAIVNAANQKMLGGGGVDGAIHRAAGPELLEYCKQVPADNDVRCPVGEARITPAGRLPARWVIHTVGPRYTIDPEAEFLLASAYRNSLTLAVKHQCRSIAFPAISCGVFGYPYSEAAEISLSICREVKWSGIKISFYLFSPELVEIWQKELNLGE